MRVGTVREIKTHEYRVGLTPSGVRSFRQRGHEVLVERGAGHHAGFEDEEYADAGASLVDGADDVYATCDMVVKVKEPQADEIGKLRTSQILFTYLHLAADRDLTEALLESGIQAVAYETITNAEGALPCLKPMSEIAGRLSVQEGAKYLEKPFGGRGILLGGVPGIPRGRIAILGGGVVGANACKIAVGIGADVTLLDVNPTRLAYLDDIFGSRVTTLYSTDSNIEMVLRECDILIGAVLIPGQAAPKLVRREHLALMKSGAVIVDVAVDQGGCVETIRPTSHDDPVYIVDEVVHYGVTNLPGAVARSSTQALTSTTLSYGLAIAEHGLAAAMRADSGLRAGLNLYEGRVTHEAVASSLGMDYVPASSALNN